MAPRHVTAGALQDHLNRDVEQLGSNVMARLSTVACIPLTLCQVYDVCPNSASNNTSLQNTIVQPSHT